MPGFAEASAGGVCACGFTDDLETAFLDEHVREPPLNLFECGRSAGL